MNENERDTHFQNFAKLLWQDIRNNLEFWIDTAEDDFQERVTDIISRRAYDLIYFLIESRYAHKGTFRGEICESISMLPDMTELPSDHT